MHGCRGDPAGRPYGKYISISSCRCTSLLLLILPAAAQENVSPLLDLLALAPDNEIARVEFVFYQDFRAVENARDYLSRPESGPAFLASEPWVGFTQRWLGMPPQVSDYAFRLMEEMPATVGFDFFDINRTLTVGAPPATAVIWSGDFDLDSIGAAHQARGYLQAEIGAIPAWCGKEGCDSGMQQDFRNIEPGNLFDPALGRPVPFLTLPGMLVSSPALEMLEAVADTSEANMPSLLDAPEYRTLAEAITDSSTYSGELVSALFLTTESVMLELDFNDPSSLAPLMGGRMTPDQLEALVQEGVPAFIANYGTLPPYQLAALADRQEDGKQVAIIVLAYESAEDAEIAAPELSRRIETFSGFILTHSDESLLSQLPSTTVESRIYTSANTGLSAAVVEVRYPTPSQEEEQAPLGSAGDGRPRVPAAFYRFLVTSVFRSGLYPLWTFANISE